MARFDPVRLGILWGKIRATADELAATVVKTAVSTSVGISEDFACSILDSRGRLMACGVPSVAQFSALLPRAMRFVLDRFPLDEWRPGDVAMSTDPWVTAGHQHDLLLVTPVFFDGRLVAFTVSLAHTADIGGQLSLSGSRDVYEEGLIVPILKIYEEDVLQENVLDMIKSNIRVPEIMMGDFHAMIAANQLGVRRLTEILSEYGLRDFIDLTDEMEEHTERGLRAAVRQLPDGVYPFELTIDGIKRPVHLQVAITVDGDALTVDYTGSDPQRKDEALNAVLNFTFSQTATAVQCVLTPRLPFNEGFLKALKIVVPEGSVLNCTKPLPVKNRDKVVAHVETLIFGALHPIVQDKVLATSGNSGVVIANGFDTRADRFFNTYICQGGGTGAGIGHDGTNSLRFPWGGRNIPIEIIETRSPIRVAKKELSRDSCGAGEFRGGCGQETVITTIPGQEDPIALALYAQNVRFRPQGFAGGLEGSLGGYAYNGVELGPDSEQVVGSFLYLQPGDELTVRLAGGAGYGNPGRRDPEALRQDIEDGYVSAAAAQRDYGVEDGLATSAPMPA